MRKLTIGIGVTLMFSVIILVQLPASLHAQGSNLVLWNKLGSGEEILNSEVGPNLEFYDPSLHGGTGCCDAIGNREYVTGPFEAFGNGVMLSGSYSVCDRIHNIILTNLSNYLSPEKGTIEAWYMQTEDPVAYFHNIYRIFDGSFGLNGGMGFQSDETSGLVFWLTFGGTQSLVAYDISAYNNTWIHIAAVWNRIGIDGTNDTMRLYVDGNIVATTTQNNWGTAVGDLADICGANDAAGYFSMDNLKIWNYAKTDFSDRYCAVYSCYTCVGFEPPMDKTVKVKKPNRVLPLKMLLLDENNMEISDLDIENPPLVEVDFTGGDPIEAPGEDFLIAGQGDEGNIFVYTDEGKWQFNLQTKNFSGPGLYTIRAVSGNPNTYIVDPACTAQFVIDLKQLSFRQGSDMFLAGSAMALPFYLYIHKLGLGYPLRFVHNRAVGIFWQENCCH